MQEKIPDKTLEEEMATQPVFLPGKSHGQRSLVGYSPQGLKESDMTERLHFHFHSAWWLRQLRICL